MIFEVQGCTLRRPEPSDAESLYILKNDPEINSRLGAFSTGMSRADIGDWIERHRHRTNEVLFVVEDSASEVVGHVGLYDIDFRSRRAEFGIMLGARRSWGQGIGTRCTSFMLDYAFDRLNLDRVHLQVLADNVRARRLYERLGFIEEGRLRSHEFRDGKVLDVILMGILRLERRGS